MDYTRRVIPVARHPGRSRAEPIAPEGRLRAGHCETDCC